MPCQLRNPIPLPIEDLLPRPEYFIHHSLLHGQPHVARVLVYTFLLVDALGLEACHAKIWAAAYVHDLGRLHDGYCSRHGRYALERLAALPDVKNLLEKGGVTASDWESIFIAVENHCREELPQTHPHWNMTAILKDADGLDRVRLGDLDPRFLRFPESHALIPFAKALYEATQDKIPAGPNYFAEVWPVAQQLIERVSNS